MRKSTTNNQLSNQPPRRSSSADNFGALSQNRHSSIGRASSIGRPSSIGCGKSGDIKPINPQELANSIYIVLEALNYGELSPISVKSLQLPSTGLFYNVFEFLLRTLGINDVWNPNLLVQPNQPKNQPISSSQPNQSNVITQNKARVELIIYHLTLLKYYNIPKPNVLQTMTTPKNWGLMLQIMYFLCNNVRFLQIYNAERLVNTNGNDGQEFISDYLKTCYSNVTKSSNYINSEDYKKYKQDSLVKFEKYLRKNSDLKQLESELENCTKTFEHLNATRKDFEILLQEEQELLRMISEEESKFSQDMVDYEDRNNRIMAFKNETISLKERLKHSEKDMSIKEADYDKQLASGKQMENLNIRHSQKAKELGNLQNLLVDLEDQKDKLYIELNQKSQEANSVISKSHEIVNKIKLSSSLPVDDLPQLEIVDMHKKANIIKEFKERFHQIRKDYTNNVCKLPIQFSKEERKMIESKIETSKVMIKNLEKETKKLEKHLKEFEISSEEATSEFNRRVNMTNNDLIECENQVSLMKDKSAASKEELKRVIDEYKKIELAIDANLKEAAENCENVKNSSIKELEKFQKSIKKEFINQRNVLRELNFEVKKHFQQFDLKILNH